MVNYKLLVVSLMCLSLVACGSNPTKVHTEYKKTYVPVYTVPKPPVVERPKLAIQDLTPEQKKDAGEVTKALTISIEQLKDYITILERILNKYKELAEQGEKKINEGNNPLNLATSETPPTAAEIAAMEKILADQKEASKGLEEAVKKDN
jgi:hypothetical protein